MRASLDRLRALPRDRLEALFTGTLDLFAYRVDAWVTSLATCRLDELRRLAPTGVVAGAFGWLEDVRPAPPRQTVPPPPDEAGSPLAVDPANAGFVHAPSLNQAATAAVMLDFLVSELAARGARGWLGAGGAGGDCDQAGSDECAEHLVHPGWSAGMT